MADVHDLFDWSAAMSSRRSSKLSFADGCAPPSAKAGSDASRAELCATCASTVRRSSCACGRKSDCEAKIVGRSIESLSAFAAEAPLQYRRRWPTRGRRGARARQLPTRCHEISAFGHGPCMGVALGEGRGVAQSSSTELLALPAQASQAVAVATDCQVSLSGCTSNLPAQPSADRRGPEARGAESPVVARRALSAYSCPRESDIAPAAGRLDQRARVARAVGRESASRILA